MATADFDEIADELYGLDPPEFVPSRTARARDAKAAGDTDLAKAVKKLRKPTQSAWMVNLLARRRPDEIAELLDLGAAILSAQRRASAEALRELSTQRQRVIGALADIAADLAHERGTTPSPAAVRDVAASLRAAIADPDVGEAVRRGRMVTAVEYSGLGPPGLVAVGSADAPTRGRRRSESTGSGADGTDSRTGSPGADDADDTGTEVDDERAAAERRREALITAAQTAVDDASSASEAAADRLTEAEARVTELHAEIEPMRAKLAQLDEELRFARRSAKTAETESRDAARERDRARTELTRLRESTD
ncbi:hypothetical protein [Gordonia soli]|uniref:Uncharacterized protein n=1 Tax=Gordonia soli NBRC 108243 TaxID=1223545 RepID=M0QM23_9ACTN|nr:hypothetical protein [Gordonia soli]GAC69628.1 hypothetical protein GS4_26_00760 [Gordonia soli NBRC 108243]